MRRDGIMIATEDYIREIVTIFFAQKRIVAFTTVVIFAAAVLIAFFWPPTYAAVGSVLVKGKTPEKSPEAIEETQTRMYAVSKEDLSSEVEIITSPDLIEKTVTFMAKDTPYYMASDLKPDKIKGIIGEIRSKLHTEIVPNSNIIKVSLQGRDADKALKILDYLMNSYVVFRKSVFSPSQAEAFFLQQTKHFDDGLKEKEEESIKRASQSGAPEPLKEIENNLLLKKDLDQRLEELRRALIEKKQYVKYLNERLKIGEVQFFTFIENSTMNALSQKTQELYTERGRLLRVFHPESDAVKRVEEQLEDTYARLKSEVAAYRDNQEYQVKILEDQIKATETKLEDLHQRNVALHTQEIESQRIKRELDLLEHSYQTFAQRLEEAKISSRSDAGSIFSISILRRPFSSGSPVFPRKKKVIPIGLVVGFITGCSLAFLKEFFDHTFKKPQEIQKYLDLQTIFSIPAWEQ